MAKFFAKFKYFDIPLQVSILLLATTGLTILYSTSLSTESTAIFWRQLIFFGIGVFCFLFFSFFDYHSLAKANRTVYVIFILLLIYLLFFGPEIRAGRRWISLGFVSFQPAELIKIVVILGLARLLHLRRGQINTFKNTLWSLCYILLPATLIVLEPDFGSALIIVGIWAGMLLTSPIKKKFLAVLFIIFLAFSGVAWKYILKDFQKDRVKVFLNPQLDPRGRGYSVKQATIAIGSGQWLGKGLGKGLQSQNKFLPEKQTDFIFAAAAEEVGFVGIFCLLGLYSFICLRLLKIIRSVKDDLGMYIATGTFFFFFLHIMINIGMNVGLLPVTGIPLPFLSAGGSSLVASFIALGIVQNAVLQSKMLRRDMSAGGGSAFGGKNFDLKKVMQWLGYILKCPICGFKYNPERTKVIDSQQNELFGEAQILIHSDCVKCKSSVMFSIEIRGPEVFSVGMITDLTREDSSKFKNRESITADEVIKIHQALKSFKGNLLKTSKTR
jgi:rod shape determining protein RodA